MLGPVGTRDEFSAGSGCTGAQILRLEELAEGLDPNSSLHSEIHVSVVVADLATAARMRFDWKW